MIEALVLRFDAPLMSFGGIVVDNIGVTDAFPGRSMITGLLASALGYRHGDTVSLEDLQGRIVYAARCDRPGREMVDYQTADLSPAYLRAGWTTRGYSEGREGGSASSGTTIRYRHYLADALFTVAIALSPAEGSPNLDAIASALEQPARPLFLGRKSCLPAAPIFVGARKGASLWQVLKSEPQVENRSQPPPWSATWPADEEEDVPGSRLVSVFDTRDWANQVHTGRRWVRVGVIDG